MIGEIENKKRIQKPLGIYLVEAGIVTPEQVKIALEAQKHSKNKLLGEVIASHGWVAQETIEYLMDKVILPERQATEQDKNEYIGLAHPSSYDPLQWAKVSTAEIKFNLSTAKIVRFLFFVVLSLILFSIWLQFSLYFLPDYPLRDISISLFDIDQERNIPVLYSVTALGFCACLLFIIAYKKKLSNDRYLNHWRALGIIFVYIAIDEAISLHERWGQPIKDRFNTSGFLYYAWVIPASILVVVFLMAFLKFIIDLPAQTKRLFLTAGTLFVGGAIGMELIGGFVVDNYGENNFIYDLCASMEEMLEMLGIVIFIGALLSYMATNLQISSVKFNLVDSRQRKSGGENNRAK